MILIIAGVAIAYVVLVLFTFTLIAAGSDGLVDAREALAYSALVWLAVAVAIGGMALAGYLVAAGIK